jgi:decaprenylphospho-beta-D-erythro-pentofuranosid-2-ulose 2-reductase
MSAQGAGSAGRRVLVLGGTSEIAHAIVEALQARAPREVVLVGRNRSSLDGAADRLRAAGSPAVSAFVCDALDTARHAAVVDEAFDRLGGVDIAIVAVGELGERAGVPSDIAAAVRTMQVNTVGAGSLLLHTAARMRERGDGTIVVLSSVAAERPRRANSVYGASKAGLDSLAQAVGDELHGHGVRVLVVRPGFVRTRMTRGLAPAPLACTPQKVASAVLAGLDGRAHTVWAPSALRWVMLAMRVLPRAIFRRIER